ncbi:hypothetical protein Goklo_008425, partial [Gossypium klotzschianum]|nr:hypothetical protein [Gossypium klotzschianum]
SGSAAIEGVLRDEKEDWVLGYNRFLGNCSIFEEKIWGILDGLKLTQRTGHEKGHTVTPHARVPGRVTFEMASHARVPGRVLGRVTA